jgi:hypothetical protein
VEVNHLRGEESWHLSRIGKGIFLVQKRLDEQTGDRIGVLVCMNRTSGDGDGLYESH